MSRENNARAEALLPQPEGFSHSVEYLTTILSGALAPPTGSPPTLAGAPALATVAGFAHDAPGVASTPTLTGMWAAARGTYSSALVGSA